MQWFYAFFILLSCVRQVLLQGPGSGSNGNLRLCIVEGQGLYKRASKFCPTLDDEHSNVECVLGTDRLDCLRRITKNRADFAVFTAEELVAAQWAAVDTLAVTEIRTRASRPFARSIVALVNKKVLDGSYSVETILRNRTLCAPITEPDDLHPLSDTIESYLESQLTHRSCDSNLTMNENKILALSEFFHSACRAGDWVTDKTRDAELKKKYPSLCSACDSQSCSRTDKYWGEIGALNCVTEGAGDVTWAERDDVVSYFQVQRKTSRGKLSSSEFAYLCRDGGWQPVYNNTDPCVWINKPWPVIVAKRKTAEAVRKLLRSFQNNSVVVDQHWRGALAQLLQLNQALTEPLDPPQTPVDYLSRAIGFREAYSQHGCVPSRHITICTTSLLANNKCDWFAEAGAVYGVTPPVQCSRKSSVEECFRAISLGEADVTIASGDWLVSGARNYSVTPILHEVTPIIEKTSTVFAYVRNSSEITKMSELRGKRASFPRFDGVAFHSFARYLGTHKSCEKLSDYFSEICAPGIEKVTTDEELKQQFTQNCYYSSKGNIIEGELQALRALVEGKSDVAFLSMNTYNMYKAQNILEPWASKSVEITHLCPEDNKKYCFLSWSNIGHIYGANNLTEMRRNEIINTFTKLDKLFGQHKHANMFSMYGLYNHEMDVLFHNNTKYLDTNEMYFKLPFNKVPFAFERFNFSEFCSLEYLRGYSENVRPMVVLVVCLVLTIVLS